jgi:uncharacterized protein YhbP (UPF0306 family)
MSLTDSPGWRQVGELLHTPAMTLATTGSDGEPHAAPVYFAAGEGLHLFFFSAARSQHSQDLARDPRAAAAIYPPDPGWQELRGLQLRGRVQVVPPGPAWQSAWEVYLARFPFVRALQAEVTRDQLYVFIPAWVRLVDNRQGFGFKQEWHLP